MKLDIKRIRKRKTEGNKISINERALVMEIKKPNWKAILKTDFKYRCSHCNNIIKQGHTHTQNGINSSGNRHCVIVDNKYIKRSLGT